MSDPMKGSALISQCGRYRYSLLREWDATKGLVVFVMLNPSTADDVNSDATMRKCVAYAQAWGYGSLQIVNLFAWRSRDPKALRREQMRGSVSRVIGPDNDAAIKGALERADFVVLAWGKDGSQFGRDAEFFKLAGDADMFCLGKTKGGQPLHPLYLAAGLKPMPWKASA